MSAWPAALEVYDASGGLVRTIAMTRDEADPTTWRLAESISFGGPHAETALIRFRDGTSQPLTPSLFASSAPINTTFL